MNMLLVLLFLLTSFVNSLYGILIFALICILIHFVLYFCNFIYYLVVPNSRSLTDSLADQDEFPYVASIQIKDVHVCSGFIYNENSIVTSASCVHGYRQYNIEFVQC
jgi:hypothetical protein